MADAKLERTYTIPLRKEYMKVPRWRRTKKAVTAVKEFLQRHMKTGDVKLERELNEHVWKHGIKNPPHHVKVTAVKDEGKVRAQLFGVKKEEVKVEKKAVAKKESEAKPAEKEVKAEEPKATEEKPANVENKEEPATEAESSEVKESAKPKAEE